MNKQLDQTIVIHRSQTLNRQQRTDRSWRIEENLMWLISHYLETDLHFATLTLF